MILVKAGMMPADGLGVRKIRFRPVVTGGLGFVAVVTGRGYVVISDSGVGYLSLADALIGHNAFTDALVGAVSVAGAQVGDVVWVDAPVGTSSLGDVTVGDAGLVDTPVGVAGLSDWSLSNAPSGFLTFVLTLPFRMPISLGGIVPVGGATLGDILVGTNQTTDVGIGSATIGDRDKTQSTLNDS